MLRSKSASQPSIIMKYPSHLVYKEERFIWILSFRESSIRLRSPRLWASDEGEILEWRKSFTSGAREQRREEEGERL